ncbi:1109_t:CDS:1, partial [Paraglomus occultum]
HTQGVDWQFDETVIQKHMNLFAKRENAPESTCREANEKFMLEV